MAVLSSQRIEDFAFEVETEHHKVFVDVTEDLGGKDSAPSPHDYLEIALAGCTAITLQMYAKRKNIPLESTDVSIHIVTEGPENEIRRDIRLKGNLTDEQRQSLLAIAEKCPIHRFLTRGAKIESHLTKEDEK
jgi:putative redox protein